MMTSQQVESAQVQRQAQQMAGIRRITEAIALGMTTIDLLQAVVDEVQTTLQITRCLIIQNQWQENAASCSQVVTQVSRATLDRAELLGTAAVWAEPYRETLEQGLMVETSDSNCAIDQDEAIKTLEITSLLLPLRGLQGYLGAIALHHCEPRVWQADEVMFVETIAQLCIPALSSQSSQALFQANVSQQEPCFRALIENASDIIVILGGNGVCYYASPSVERVLGYTQAGVIGKSAIAFVHPDDQPLMVNTLETAIQQPRVSQPTIEYRVRHTDGSWRLLEATTTSLLDDPMVEGVLVNCRDISDRDRAQRGREQAEAALTESELKFRTLITNIPGAVYRRTHSSEWQGMYVSNAIADITGYSAAEFSVEGNRTLSSIIHPEDQVWVEQVFDAAVKERQSFVLEYRVVHADDSIRWVYDTGQPMFDTEQEFLWLDGVLVDVSDRKQAELELQALNLDLEQRVQQRTEELVRSQTELQENQWLLQKIADTIPNILYLYDLAEQRNVYVNSQFSRQLGYPSEVIQVEGTTFFMDTLHSDDKHIPEEFNQRCMAAQDGEIVEMEYRLRRADGAWRWLHNNSIVFSRTPEGLPRQILGVAQDVTARKQGEEDLRASLEEKNVLLKEVHHRVKNNLQTISSLLRLQAATVQDAHVLEPLQESQSRVQAMALVHEKLYQSTDLARIDFADYVRALTSDLLRSYKAQSNAIQLHLDVAAIDLGIDTAIPCGLILNELVSNALKYAFPKGTAGAIGIRFAAEAEQYVLEVWDNGVGIPESIDFRQTKSLGLQLVCALARQVRGMIKLERNLGSQFKITFADPKQVG